MKPVLLWLGNDLRLDDNPALHAAIGSTCPVLPVYVFDDRLGAASRWWLHHSLSSLAADLAARGAPLVLRRGDSASAIVGLARDVGATEVHCGAPHEPAGRAAADAVADALRQSGGTLRRHRCALLFDPDSIRTQAGNPFGVFTPFARACQAHGVPRVSLPAPGAIPSLTPPGSERLDAWNLLPRKPDWADGLRETWRPGEAGAARRLAAFMADGVTAYDRSRNLPGSEGTSMLSPHLHWGEIAPRLVWHASLAADPTGGGGKSFRNELLWREFAAHLLHHNPSLPRQPLKGEFAAMPWRDDPGALAAWQRGRTGVPMVDAGMRQLWQTGWLHNRVRMVVASFLIKHLLIDWREGEAWFWDTLVDADLAANAASWQWVAGCGADAAPFFRVFNPVLQGAKFDPLGRYVRRFVPEIAALPDRFIHAPWDAPEEVRAQAGVALGRTYPFPIVDLQAGRQRALDAFKAISRSAA